MAIINPSPSIITLNSNELNPQSKHMSDLKNKQANQQENKKEAKIQLNAAYRRLALYLRAHRL